MNQQEGMVAVLASLPAAVQWTLYLAVVTLIGLAVVAGVLASRRTTARIAKERRKARRELAALYAEIMEKDPGLWHPLIVPGAYSPLPTDRSSAA